MIGPVGASPYRVSPSTKPYVSPSRTRREKRITTRSREPTSMSAFIIERKCTNHAPVYNLITAVDAYWSTIRPGRPSFSPWIQRNPVVNPVLKSSRRISSACRIFFCHQASSIVTGLPTCKTLTLIGDSGSHNPIAANLRLSSNITAKSPLLPDGLCDSTA